MADGISFDFSELMKLAADLGDTPDTAGPFINSAVQVTSKRITDEVKKEVGSGLWKGAAAAIDYDVTADGHRIESEIGYDKDKAGGALGNIREFGAPGAPSGVLKRDGFVPFPGSSAPRAPHNDLANALRDNEDDFVKGLNRAVDDAMKASNL